MPNYYRISDPNDVRDLTDQMAIWLDAGNPKASDWTVQPAAPSEDAVWQDGAWVVPPVPTTTAEEHLTRQGYTPLRLLTCLDLEAKLRAVGGSSPKLTSVRNWLDSILGKFALNPIAASNWEEPPYNYEETIQEAVMALTHSTKE